MQIIIQPPFEYNSRPHRRYLAFILSLVVLAILAVMALGAVLAAWQETSRIWAQEDKQQSMSERYDLRVEEF